MTQSGSKQREGLVKAKDVIEELLKKYDLTPDSYAVFEIWNKELGALAKKVKLAGKDKGCLLVKVDNPVYLQEIKVRKKEFIDKINGHFGKKVVDDIKVIR